jgi:hypothetical protein
VDWPNISEARRTAVIAAARRSVVAAAPAAAARTGKILEVEFPKLITGTKAAMQQTTNLAAGVVLNQVDKKVIDAVLDGHGQNVLNRFGRRSLNLSEDAREIVASGLKRGLGREAIAAELAGKLTSASQSFNYWRTTANAMANRARSYGSISFMAEAGVQRYTVEAVLDKNTTVQCRFMHGKEFTVQGAQQNFLNTAATGNVQTSQPWMQMGKDDQGNEVIYYKDDQGERQNVANVTSNASGKVNQTGSFSKTATNDQLQQAGIDTPPFHGNCRTTIIADVDSASAQVPEQIVAPAPGAFPVPPPRPITGFGLQADAATARAAPGVKPWTPPPPVTDVKAWAGGMHEDYDVLLKQRVGTKPAENAARKARKKTRDLLEGNYGMRSRDTHFGKHRSGSIAIFGKDSNYFRASGAIAEHDGFGGVAVKKAQLAKANRALRDIAKGKKPRLADAEGLSTMIHEEIHGASHMVDKGYVGVGIGMEEAATETLARRVMRDVLGETDIHSKTFGLPKWTTGRGLGSGRYTTIGMPGRAYDDFISEAMNEVYDAAAEGLTDVAKKELQKKLPLEFERAMLRTRGSNLNVGHLETEVGWAKSINQFTDELTESLDLSRDAKAKLRVALKNRKTGPWR